MVGIFRLVADWFSVANVHGIFIADGNIIIRKESTGELQFFGEGSFIANKIVLRRGSQGELINETKPMESFSYRPDLIFNTLPELWTAPYTWEELPPAD